MKREYYTASIADFLSDDPEYVLLETASYQRYLQQLFFLLEKD